uniref:uncharacterized protein LOC120347598 n=1 Tax=Styela clava TaxID=7725 RepID=UPI0019398D11|nr:uncharacterized protein LOC120347598 [Styela clava]
MRERRACRTASIPSKSRVRSAGNEMRGSLVVRKLHGVTSPLGMTSSMDGVVLPNGEALSNMSSSRLREDLKHKLSNVEYDQRSLELLVRLLRTGPFVREVVNDENRRPDISPPPPSIDDLSESTNFVSEYVVGRSPSSKNVSPRFRQRPVTTDPSVRFRKSIEELKEARERFGVCMSVNGTIAKVRSLQQRNEKSRRNAGRDKLPALNGSSSSGDSLDDENRHVTARNYGVITPLGPWLTLSGRKIQLKRQDHVKQVLGHAEHLTNQPEQDFIHFPRQKRTVRSAPPKASIKAMPVKKLAWSDGNKLVMTKVNRSFRNVRNPIRFSASFPGFETPILIPGTEIKENESSARILPSPDNKFDQKEQQPSAITPTPPLSYHSNESASRPASGSMPRPVRSVVIKLPNTGILTSPSVTSPNMTSPNMVTSNSLNSLPVRPTIRLESLRKLKV